MQNRQVERVTPCNPLQGLAAHGVQRTARPTPARCEHPLIFRRETGSVPLVRIPSTWAESGPFRRRLYLATSRDETNSFAQLVFLFSPAWEFRQRWDSASERSRHPHGFSLIAKQIGRAIPPQREPRPRAFVQVLGLQEGTSSRVTWVCVALVSGIPTRAAQTAAVFAWEPQIFFRGQRLLPAHVFSRPE